jgi:hypothetical protein
MRHVATSFVASVSITFCGIISQTARFSGEKKTVIELEMYVLIFFTNFVQNVCDSKKNLAR